VLLLLVVVEVVLSVGETLMPLRCLQFGPVVQRAKST